jgi:hypothetical protein
MATPTLNKLQAACNVAHAGYKAARQQLASAINKSPDAEVVADIAASLEEYGLHATLKRVKTNDPKVADAITKLTNAADTLSLAVSDRELYLLANTTGHQRAFVSDGREYKFDVGEGMVTWLDNPGKPEKVDVQKLDKLPYFDTIEMDTPDLGTPVIEDDEDDDDQPRKGRRR